MHPSDDMAGPLTLVTVAALVLWQAGRWLWCTLSDQAALAASRRHQRRMAALRASQARTRTVGRDR